MLDQAMANFHAKNCEAKIGMCQDVVKVILLPWLSYIMIIQLIK